VAVAGVLLTGGASRRIGSPKAELLLDGERLVDRTARVVGAVCTPVVEVGPGFSPYPAVREEPPGSGPLAAVGAAEQWLDDEAFIGPAIVVAVDLPHLDEGLVRWLAGHPASASVVPVVAGRAQPLCARYSTDALAAVPSLLEQGDRSMHALLDVIDVEYVNESGWSGVCDARAFADVDTPEDVDRAGLRLPDPPAGDPSRSRR
jgi:molybdopterin-guanine dinucleotide biosynthesis protein A